MTKQKKTRLDKLKIGLEFIESTRKRINISLDEMDKLEIYSESTMAALKSESNLALDVYDEIFTLIRRETYRETTSPTRDE